MWNTGERGSRCVLGSATSAKLDLQLQETTSSRGVGKGGSINYMACKFAGNNP